MSETLRHHWANAQRDPAPHLAQLYASDGFAGEAIARFLGPGLERGERGLVFAAAPRRQALAAALPGYAEHVASGQLEIVDAEATLGALEVDGRLDPARFVAEVTPRLGGRVRIYGEIVSLLWAAGRPDEAIELERWWNEALVGRDVVLLCGYALDAIALGGAPLDGVSAAHVHVLPSERTLGASPAAQLARIGELELRDRALSLDLHSSREGEAFLRSIVEQSRDCIKLLDLDARLVFMSKGGMAQLEICDFVPLRGANWLSFWDGEDLARATAAVERARAGGVGEFVGLFPLVISKAQRWFHVVVSPIRGDDGRVTSLLAVSRDVTDRKVLEDELRRAVQARDQFLSVASHELKTPITSLTMQLDGVRRKLEHEGAVPPERLARLVEVARRQTARLISLVESMLDVSRLRDGRIVLARQPTDLAELVRGVIERFRDELAAAGSEVGLALAPGITGPWDRSRLEQVVENLLTNALRYAPGTRVELTVAGDDRDATLVVRDRGPGIPADQRARVFERFERGASHASAGRGGLGLGLYIAREIVRAHGGSIRVDDAILDGAALVVELPRGAEVVAA